MLLVVDVSRVSLSADALDAAEATDAADVARDLVFRSVAVTGGGTGGWGSGFRATSAKLAVSCVAYGLTLLQ